MSLQYRIAMAAIVMLLPWAPGAHAAPAQFSTEQVTVSLVASHTQVQPGGTITVGLHQKIIPHWHTYWQNPGDSGIATRIEWRLPAGSEAGAIEWPVPKRFEIGTITNYGYDDAVTLLSDIKVPADAKVGSTFDVEAAVNWLVCHEICIPQQAQLGLSVAVVAASKSGGTRPPENELISQARLQLPVEAAWSAKAFAEAQNVRLQIPAAALAKLGAVKDAWFYPLEWARVAHNGAQPLQADAQQLTLALPVGESPGAVGQSLPGVLVLTHTVDGKEVQRGFSIKPVLQLGSNTPGAVARAGNAAVETQTPVAGEVVNQSESIGLGAALVLALLGGLVLNLMPCVFPVLSIKALSLVQHSKHSAAQARWHGAAYTLGVLASFALLAAVLLAIKAGGGQVGWGFQFHSPAFVLLVAYLMLAVGLNLSGVFTIGSSVAGIGSGLANRSGYAGSFFTGVLATVVATPCTAPFMGGAIGFALAQPPAVLIAVFLSLGLGLALPYLLLSCWPVLQRWLPQPGAWMERFKQLLAFPMYGAAAWLVWVLAQQAGVNAVGAALLGMVGIGFAAWLYDSTRHTERAWRQHAGSLVALAVLATAVWGGYTAADQGKANNITQAASTRDAEPYTKARFDALRAQGQPVFLNFTAAWCITCLANERVALSQDTVKQAFAAQGIHYLKGDWTNQDPQISQVLSAFGRSGVPLYVYYPKGSQSKPVVLPQLLTPQGVIQEIESANAQAVASVSSTAVP